MRQKQLDSPRNLRYLRTSPGYASCASPTPHGGQEVLFEVPAADQIGGRSRSSAASSARSATVPAPTARLGALGPGDRQAIPPRHWRRLQPPGLQRQRPHKRYGAGDRAAGPEPDAAAADHAVERPQRLISHGPAFAASHSTSGRSVRLRRTARARALSALASTVTPAPIVSGTSRGDASGLRRSTKEGPDLRRATPAPRATVPHLPQ